MYPVMLDVRNRRCLVVGGGNVAQRKAQGLVEEGAKVTLVAPGVVAPIGTMADEGRLSIERRGYEQGEASSYALVFAATDDREVNEMVYADSIDAGVLVYVAVVPVIC